MPDPSEENERPRRGAPVASSEEAAFIRGLSTLSPRGRAAARAALGIGSAPVAGVATPGGPKFSAALEAIADDDVPLILEAIDLGIDRADNEGGDRADPLATLRDVSPELAAAASANSAYRRKDLAHSLRVAKQWLETHHEIEVVEDDDAPAVEGEEQPKKRRAKRKGKR